MLLLAMLTQQKYHQVWDGKWKKVVVGCRVHGFVLDNDKTDSNVANHTRNENHHIKERQWKEQIESNMFWTQNLIERQDNIITASRFY